MEFSRKNGNFENEYLLRYSEEHLLYEVSMLFGLVKILSVTKKSEGGLDNIEKNALLESFGIHLRNLIDFLYCTVKKQDDVVAADFLDEGEWSRIRPEITKTLSYARTRANKEFMHLTSRRISGTPDNKQWEFRALSTEIKPALKLFVESADSGKLSPKTVSLINKCCDF